jgi:predicted TIM-barrel fold metal-dependent hydrolase
MTKPSEMPQMPPLPETQDLVVDGDSHILEPPDLWTTYLEDKYKERAIKIVRSDGREQLWMDNEVLLPGGLPVLGGVDVDRQRLLDPESGLTYMDAAPPSSMYGDARLEMYDRQGISAGLALPTIGILWDVDDVELGNAYARAYNRWLYDFQEPDRERIITACHLHLKDPDEALRELKRCLKLGFKSIFLPPERPDGKPLTHPDFAPIWRELEETGVPAVLHLVVRLRNLRGSSMGQWYEPGQTPRLFAFALGATLQVIPAVCAIVTDGLFDQFPRLKVLCVEAGAGWAAYIMDRLDAKYRHFGFETPLDLGRPSEYFRRNLWFCAEPEERTIDAMLDLVGDERILWGSDFPHVDSCMEAPAQIRASVAGLSEPRRRAVLGENAQRLFGLGAPAPPPERKEPA